MMTGARQDSVNVVAAHISCRHGAAKTRVADNYLVCPRSLRKLDEKITTRIRQHA
jgi:hypothetical protein